MKVTVRPDIVTCPGMTRAEVFPCDNTVESLFCKPVAVHSDGRVPEDGFAKNGALGAELEDGFGCDDGAAGAGLGWIVLVAWEWMEPVRDWMVDAALASLGTLPALSAFVTKDEMRERRTAIDPPFPSGT